MLEKEFVGSIEAPEKKNNIAIVEMGSTCKGKSDK